MLEKIYLKKDINYFTTIRKDIVEFIKNEKKLVILEVGAGTGNTLRYLKQEGIAEEIHLIDIVDIVEEKKDFDSIRILDIENASLDSSKKYDIIILADVLEHLHDPEEVVKKLKNLLKEEGRFLVSLPNIRHWSAIKKIFLKGSFKYEDHGIFDKTHFRFFCKSDMIKLFDVNKDLNVKSIKPISDTTTGLTHIMDRFTFRLFTQFLTMQYLFEVQKKTVSIKL